MKLIITTKEARELILRWPPESREDPSGFAEYSVSEDYQHLRLQCSEEDAEQFCLYNDEEFTSDVLPEKQMRKFINWLSDEKLISDVLATK